MRVKARVKIYLIFLIFKLKIAIILKLIKRLIFDSRRR